jgi:hypothetical protein
MPLLYVRKHSYLMIWDWFRDRKRFKEAQKYNEEHYTNWPLASIALVSSMCVGPERKRVRYMHRMPPRFKQESGWILYCGEESDDFADDWQNFKRVVLSSCIEDDASLASVLESAIGSEWTRKAPEDIWRRIIDGKVIDENGQVIG